MKSNSICICLFSSDEASGRMEIERLEKEREEVQKEKVYYSLLGHNNSLHTSEVQGYRPWKQETVARPPHLSRHFVVALDV